MTLQDLTPIRRRLACLGVLLTLSGALTAGAFAGGSRRPDLVEAGLYVLPRAVPVGGSLGISDLARNRGPGAAARSTTGYYLSRDRLRGSGDFLLGRRPVGALGAGEGSFGAAKVRIPTSVVPGTYRVLACADDRRRVPESDETNNCRATPHRLAVTNPPGADRVAPTFAGLMRAVTCIPGPADGGRSASYRLGWEPATDDVTPSSEIVYDVYQATAPGGEDFSTPTYTTAPGASSFTTPPLAGDKAWYFVVHARDRADNRDANTVERVGMNLCL